MALAYSEMVDVANVPPVVSNDRQALPFVLEACSVLRERHGVSVVYDRRGEASRGVVRGNQTLFGAFDPPRSWASDIFGVMAIKDDEVIGVLQMAIYDLGTLTLGQYVGAHGPFRDGPNIRISGRAIGLMAGITGTVGFNGDLWVSTSHRKSEFSKDWMTYAAMINRVLAMSTRNTNGVFLFAREKIAAIARGRAEKCYLGATWNGERRALLWSSQYFIRQRMHELCPDLM
jgi:hypothetical protein